MRTLFTALTAALVLPAVVAAALPRLAVVTIDSDEPAPDREMIDAVAHELASSGRFDVVDLGGSAFIQAPPDSLFPALRSLAAGSGLDMFLALELLEARETDRTFFRGDSLVTLRSVEVTLLGRFHSSTGTLIGTITQTRSAEEELPFSPDVGSLAVSAAVDLAGRCILELFPLEVSFTAGSGRLFEIPIGTLQGVDGGTVMSVVAASAEIPSDPSGYEYLRSRGLLQILRAGSTSSTARLLSGRLVPGGPVTALEQSAPALVSACYRGGVIETVAGTGLEAGEEPSWDDGIRLGVATGKWGFALGGGISASILERASILGVDLGVGFRLPLSSPALGLRLSGGAQVLFLTQDVRSDTLSSSATAAAVNGIADVSAEWLFADHLGMEIGIGAVIGSAAETWTVQEYTGRVRDANPDELYYTSLREGPVSLRAGLFYLAF